VVNSSPDDIQLEQLLTQLLRVVVVPAARSASSAAGMSEAYAVPAVANAGDAENAGTGGRSDGDEGGSGAPPGQAGASQGQPPDAAVTAARLPSVSASEARALIELMSARGIAQGELAGLLGLDKSTVSRLASGLERKGWIRRGRDEGNQRYVRLYLTAQGGEIAGRVWQAWHSRQARLLAALSDEERAGLSAGLRGLVRGLAAEGLLSESPENAGN
jgi:DNA-binding MarR family transcriptional regulator